MTAATEAAAIPTHRSSLRGGWLAWSETERKTVAPCGRVVEKVWTSQVRCDAVGFLKSTTDVP